MELRDMRFFCVAADMEHISRAAEKLEVSQPFLTKVITQLEKELGCKLFDRIGRRVCLNRYGQLFYEDASRILSQVDELQERFARISSDMAQPVILAADTSSYCSDIPLKYLAVGGQVKMTYMPREEIIKAIAGGVVDFGISSPPIHENEVCIETEIVKTETACLLVPAAHPLAGKSCIELSDLNGLNLITSLKGSSVRNNIDSVCRISGVTPNIVLETIDSELILQSVKEGIGCAVFPQSFVDRLKDSESYVVLTIRGAGGQVGLSRNRNAPLTKACEAFAGFAKNYFSQL